MVAALAAWAAGFAAPAAATAAPPRVTVAVLPQGVTVEEIGAIEGISPGLLSPGIGGDAGAAQTYLDISQGARTFEHFYELDLPALRVTPYGIPSRLWAEVLERAASAPAEIEPGLLAATLEEQGVRVRAAEGAGLAGLIAVHPDGRIHRPAPAACSERGCGPGLSVLATSLERLPEMVAAQRGEDLLIAIPAAPPPENRQLPVGVAGAGFAGTLTSDSTRTEGLILTSDLARTIVERFRIEPPPEMAGGPVFTEGEADAAAVAQLEKRLGERPTRGAVVGLPIAAWLLVVGIVVARFRARGARSALPMLALSGVYLPAMLLVGAAVQPAEWVEALIVGLGAPLLAALTLAGLSGYAALACACALTVAAYAVDVVTGSHLTALSVLGPNPGLGVRFYGIGNELEAILASLVLIGAGAALGCRRRSPRAAAIGFAAAALAAAAVFAPGRFGADVGAAIVLAAGGATAAAIVLGLGWRGTVALLALAAVGGFGALALVDVVSGGDSHLTRSVLDAESSEDVAAVLERRLRLTVRSFTNPAYPLLLVLTAGLLAVGIIRRRRILGWFGDRVPARAGYIAAAAAGVVGTLANDSGAILMIIATIYLAVCAGFFWARQPPESRALEPRGAYRPPASQPAR